MNINKSIIISIFVHILILAAVISNRAINYPGSANDAILMDIFLEPEPAHSQKSKNIKPINNKSAKLIKDAVKSQDNQREIEKDADGSAQVKHIETGGARDFNTYFAQVRSQIINNKYYPKSSYSKNQEGKVTLSFTISRDGKVQNVIILNKCFYKSLNNAALNTITKAAPFPIFPNDIHSSSLKLKITLEYSIDEFAKKS
ncbi:MAG: TonB family protein [bacterium]